MRRSPPAPCRPPPRWPRAGTGHGLVFEKYTRKPGKDGNTELTDAGSMLQLSCGPFSAEWSRGGWVYFPDRDHLLIAVTDATRLEDVDVRDPEPVWLRKKE